MTMATAVTARRGNACRGGRSDGVNPSLLLWCASCVLPVLPTAGNTRPAGTASCEFRYCRHCVVRAQPPPPRTPCTTGPATPGRSPAFRRNPFCDRVPRTDDLHASCITAGTAVCMTARAVRVCPFCCPALPTPGTLHTPPVDVYSRQHRFPRPGTGPCCGRRVGPPGRARRRPARSPVHPSGAVRAAGRRSGEPGGQGVVDGGFGPAGGAKGSEGDGGTGCERVARHPRTDTARPASRNPTTTRPGPWSAPGPAG